MASDPDHPPGSVAPRVARAIRRLNERLTAVEERLPYAEIDAEEAKRLATEASELATDLEDTLGEEQPGAEAPLTEAELVALLERLARAGSVSAARFLLERLDAGASPADPTRAADGRL